LYVYALRIQLTSNFEGQPSKRRPKLQSKQGASWFLGNLETTSLFPLEPPKADELQPVTQERATLAAKREKLEEELKEQERPAKEMPLPSLKLIHPGRITWNL